MRSMKYHLRRCSSEMKFSLEEFETLLYRIEAILNSRPLYPLSESLEDLNTLTPGHFLITTALTAPPEPSHIDTNDNLLTRFQLAQKVYQKFWTKWSQDYLHSLLQRKKWYTRSISPTIGQLVLIREPSNPLQWKKGRIVEIFPGSDQLNRVVLLKTQFGEIKRPLVKISPLL